jgi:hypothetical protein
VRSASFFRCFRWIPRDFTSCFSAVLATSRIRTGKTRPPALRLVSLIRCHPARICSQTGAPDGRSELNCFPFPALPGRPKSGLYGNKSVPFQPSLFQLLPRLLVPLPIWLSSLALAACCSSLLVANRAPNPIPGAASRPARFAHRSNALLIP